MLGCHFINTKVKIVADDFIKSWRLVDILK